MLSWVDPAFNKLTFSDSASIKKFLDENPGYINAQTKNGATILHRVVLMAAGRRKVADSKAILTMLFCYRELDFNIQDEDGDTPLHIAGCYFEKMMTDTILFTMLIREAVQRNFNFSILNHAGRSVLHLIAMQESKTYVESASFFFISNANYYNDHCLNNLEEHLWLLIYAMKEPELNILCHEGGTAFYYAIDSGRYNLAVALSRAGADIMLQGSPTKNPFARLNEKYRNDDSLKESVILSQLKEKMHSIIKCTAEVKKNVIVLAQGYRGHHRFFRQIPEPILMTIASLTGGDSVEGLKYSASMTIARLSFAAFFSARSKVEKSERVITSTGACCRKR